ncbi:helix-turn-helix transcriptional regulator [Streptomyces sp. NPDC006173]|uniref:response regulator transcription factor n=1 Tax=Streptomyces sp. NPDC006173 TaxID=3155349 RepID=UPI0033CDADBD
MACATEFEGLGADLLAAEAAVIAAAAWRRIGETRKATAAANQSAAMAPRCGEARTPAFDTAIEPVTALTSHEREIAILTATGASAQAVAESLSISRRTVQSHLYNICGKLGVSNRSELKKTLGGDG